MVCTRLAYRGPPTSSSLEPSTFHITFTENHCPKTSPTLSSTIRRLAEHSGTLDTRGLNILHRRFRGGKWHSRGRVHHQPHSVRLPDGSTAFQAELGAILCALQHAKHHPATTVNIFTDNLAALQAITNFATKDNRIFIPSIQHLLQNLHIDDTHTNLVWIPGHSGIQGNERADNAACMAASDPTITFPVTPSYITIKTLLHSVATDESERA